MIAARGLFDLTGKTALVTGATGHLGRPAAWALARAGAAVLVNSRSRERVSSLVDEMRARGLSAHPLVFDVTDFESAQAVLRGLDAGPLHVLVNNAYSGGAGTLLHQSRESYLNSYDAVVGAAHNLLVGCIGALRRGVQQDGDASIINVASMYGVVSPDLRVYDSPEVANPPNYGAAKAALIQWTRYAAAELGREAIRVNSISPGPFPAPEVQSSAPEFVSLIAAKTMLGRVGHQDEICGPLVFLASSASSYVTGTNLSVDAGWTAW